ncbi:zinc finger protein [Apiospora arundinis]|uniref:Zinc finger protein n=1 Tax=Apiospora arundinis TaxID=335852 RepID=A0ABR2IAK1_9PEZI
MESSHNENNSAQAGGADTVGPVEHRCPVCGKVLGTTKTLQQHHRIHDKNETCDLCGNGFARVELLKMHKLNKHKTNTSPFICFMGGCRRARLGLTTEALLVQHLANPHSGATLADNQKAQAAATPDAGNGDNPSAEDAAAAPPREDGGMVEHDNGDQRLIPTVYEMSMQEYLNQSDRKIQQLGNQVADERSRYATEPDDTR